MQKEWFRFTVQRLGILQFVLVLLFVRMFLMPSSVQGAQPKQILVMNSYHLDYIWTDQMTHGIADALRGEGKGIQIRYEYMDTKRVSGPAYFKLLFETYRYKYRNARFDVIIATDNDAFEFLKQYRDALFPATPVVFCGVNYFEPSQLEGKKLFTGVNEAADIKATLDLALQIHPEARQIVVINEKSTTGRIVHRELEKLIPAYQDRVKFQFLEDMEMPEILEAVQKLGNDSLVFFTVFFRDKAGSFYEYDEGITLVANNSPVPVYGAWDFYLGYGLMGGMLTSGYSQGEAAGKMALRILKGEKVENIPVVMKSPNHYMFDYRQLQRFHIDMSALPAGSTVINQPSALYHVSRKVFWGGAATLAASVVIILLLLYNTAIRRRAERELRNAAIKYRIVADNTYNWEFWLDPEGRFLYTSPSCQRITGHTTAEFLADPGLLQRIIHPDNAEQLAAHRHDITSKPERGELEFRIVRQDGEISWIHHVCLPVFDDSNTFLGTRASNTDITERKQAEEKNMRLAAIVDSSDDAIIGKSLDGTITSWNKGAEKIFGYTEEEMVGRQIGTIVPPEYVNELLLVHEKIRKGEHIEHFETVRTKKHGERRHMSLTYSPVMDGQGEVVAVSTIGRDITERKNAERLLLDSARINRELEIAKEIQQSFLSSFPSQLPGLQMASCCQPAAQVGGDYYDFFTHEKGVVDLVIADITGHSVGSALLMTETRSVLHAKVGTGRSPGNLLSVVNDLLHDDLCRAELQISMFYARLDTEKSMLVYSNAGHNRPFLYRSRGGVLEELDADGMLMGVITGTFFEEKNIGVGSGDILLMYTDGVTEAENAWGEQFGAQRLGKIVADNFQRHPKEIMDAIQGQLDLFCGDRPRDDDIAMIVIKIEPGKVDANGERYPNKHSSGHN